MIIANKWWEADPLCAVLIHDKARPSGYSNFKFPHYPASPGPKPTPGMSQSEDPIVKPRMTCEIAGAAVEVWCIEELMNPSQHSSSSAEKARVLPSAFASGQSADLIIAFGTAGSRPGIHANGSVVVGRRVFIHDPLATNPGPNHWVPPVSDAVVDSLLDAQILYRLTDTWRASAEVRFIYPPVEAADPMLVLIGNGFISLGVVNITSYDDYSWADSAAVASFERAGVDGQIGSIETTHGVIRSSSECPFLFVSGITDTEGLFDFQVTPRAYAQNTAAAHNAGITVAWLLPALMLLL